MRFINIVFIVAITMALSITITMKNNFGGGEEQEEEKPPFATKLTPNIFDNQKELMPSKRLSRFLVEHRSLRGQPASHCHKDHEICRNGEGNNTTCCNNKCVNLHYDKQNCGACKKKCEYSETCCRGECVELSMDKRHCGYCNRRCKKGEFCFYGDCDYA